MALTRVLFTIFSGAKRVTPIDGIRRSISSRSHPASRKTKENCSTAAIPDAHFGKYHGLIERHFSTAPEYSWSSFASAPVLKQEAYDKILESINYKSADDAQEETEIPPASEFKETHAAYFDVDAEIVKNAVQEVLDMYYDLLGRLSESHCVALQLSLGLKLEQLRTREA